MSAQSTTYGGMPLGRESTTHAGLAAFKRISWGSVIAGALIALVIQLCLSLLGMGIGMGTVNPTEESNPFAGLGVGSLIWWSITMLISLFLGGWVAGRLAGLPRTFDSVLHGLLTWSLVTLLSFYLLTTAVGKIIGGVGSILGKTVSLAGKGIGAVAPEVGDAVKDQLANQNIDLSNLRQEAALLLQQTGKPELQPGELKQEAKELKSDAKQSAQTAAQNPGATGQTADNIIDQVFMRGGNVLEEVDKQAVVNVIVARTGKSEEEASRIADNWMQSFQQAKTNFNQKKEQLKAQTEKTAEDAASAMSKAGIFGFIGLVLGAAAASFGGKVGKPDEVIEVVNR